VTCRTAVPNQPDLVVDRGAEESLGVPCHEAIQVASIYPSRLSRIQVKARVAAGIPKVLTASSAT
jgi:hypothetical protein